MHIYSTAHYGRLSYCRRTIGAAVLGCVLWTTGDSAWATTAEEKPIAERIAALCPSLSKAVLHIGTIHTTYNVARKEADLPGISCEYILTDPKSLSTLMDILNRATFVNDRPPKITDVRVGIYLHERNGSMSKILLNAPFLGEGSKGRFNDHTGVVTNLTFDKDLRNFASTLKQTKPNYECDSEKAATR